MDQHRWQRIERLYHSALERDPEQRSSYLAQECRDDEDLRREVESLLKELVSSRMLPALSTAGRSRIRSAGELFSNTCLARAYI